MLRYRVLEQSDNYFLEILHFKDWLRHDIQMYVTAFNNIQKVRHYIEIA